MKSRKTGKSGVKAVKTGYTLLVERKNGIL